MALIVCGRNSPSPCDLTSAARHSAGRRQRRKFPFCGLVEVVSVMRSGVRTVAALVLAGVAGAPAFSQIPFPDRDRPEFMRVTPAISSEAPPGVPLPRARPRMSIPLPRPAPGNVTAAAIPAAPELASAPTLHQHAGHRAAAGAGGAGNCRSSRGGRQDDADPVLRTAPGISDNSHTRLGIGATAGSVTSWLGRTRRSRPTGAASSRIRYQTFKPLDLESGTTALLFPQERCSFPKEHGPDLPRAPQPQEVGANLWRQSWQLRGPKCGRQHEYCVLWQMGYGRPTPL